jgi:hypothetical protein
MDWKGLTAISLAAAIGSAELKHEAVHPHTDIGHQEGNNVPDERMLRIVVATTSAPYTPGAPIFEIVKH